MPPIPTLSPSHWVILWTLLGLFVGSFLNVCIHRLPLEDETVSKPRRSRCPSCKTSLTWRENVPLVSWLVQRGRCRHCAWPIPLRYPLVELGNAGLWYVAIRGAGASHPALWLTWSVVLSALLVATVVDFQHFEIPDEISLGGIALAPVACLLVPELHADTALAGLLAGGGTVGPLQALAGGVAGILAGGGVLWIIGWMGSRAYGVEAMGLGDVKLLAAAGGFVGPGAVLVALMIAAFVASFFGIANMLRFYCITRARGRRRGRRDPLGRSLRIAHLAGRYLPFGPFLAIGIGIVLLRWNDVLALRPPFGGP